MRRGDRHGGGRLPCSACIPRSVWDIPEGVKLAQGREPIGLSFRPGWGSIPHDVRSMIATDGSSPEPEVRRLIDEWFDVMGVGRGEEPTSVAKSLMLRGLDQPV